MQNRSSNTMLDQKLNPGVLTHVKVAMTKAAENCDTETSIFDTLYRRLTMLGVSGFAYIQIPQIGAYDFKNPIRENRGLEEHVEMNVAALKARYIRNIASTMIDDAESKGYFHAFPVTLGPDAAGQLGLRLSPSGLADYVCCLTISSPNNFGFLLMPINGGESSAVLYEAYGLCNSAQRDLSHRRNFLNADKHARSQLTVREKSIMELVVQGKTTPAIAEALNISPHTVSKHIQHVVLKLNVENRISAVFRVIAEGLVDY